MKTLKNLLWLSAALFCIASCNKEEMIEKKAEIIDGKVPVNTEIVVDGVVQTNTRAASEAGYTTGDGLYDITDRVTVAAFANDGYELAAFYDKKDPSTNLGASHTFDVLEPRVFKAEFAKKYTITVSASPTDGGTVSGGGKYRSGKTCTLTATANAGYLFDGWYENGTKVSSNASYSFTVSSNRTITGKFVELHLAILGEEGYINTHKGVKKIGTNTWNAIAYGNGKYITVGYSLNKPGYLTTSSDAQRWTVPERFGTIINSPSIAYGNGKFVVTSGSLALTTIDGYTWKSNQIGSISDDQSYDVYYINGLFFALDTNSYGGYIYSSSDGEVWTKSINSFNNSRMKSITYGNGLYHITTQYSDNQTDVYSSTDGGTWKYLSRISGGVFNITYGNGKFVAVSSKGYTTTSTDGITWTTPETKGLGGGLVVKYVEGKFAVVNLGYYSARISTSTDGINWTAPELIKDEVGNPLKSKLSDICVIP